jgi:CheY-like chemotaxis protein
MITATTLNGHPCRVLVVEDEALIAMLVEDMIHDSGGEMVGSAGTLSDAVDLARTAQADVALLDLDLKGTLAYPAADVLRERGMPIVFTSGYGSHGVIERFRDCPILDKPFDQHSLEQAIDTALKSNAGSPDLAA